MNEFAISYYKENTNYYINGFVDFWFEWYDYIPSDDDCKIEFKIFMENYKNIKIDLRLKLWKNMLNKAIDKILQRYEEKEEK